jgi:hypothetical protein
MMNLWGIEGRFHYFPVRLGLGGCSFQFGCTSTRSLPHALHFIRSRKRYVDVVGVVVNAEHGLMAARGGEAMHC